MMDSECVALALSGWLRPICGQRAALGSPSPRQVYLRPIRHRVTPP